MSARALIVLLSVLSFVSLACGRARAHELRPAAVSIEQLEGGRFQVAVAPSLGIGAAFEPEVVFPEPCKLDGRLLDCGTAGLNGEVYVKNLSSARNQVIVRVTFLDGRDLTALLTAEVPGLAVRSAVRNQGAGGRLALEYARLGVEHILLGFDHLLFVLGLVLLLGFGRRLLIAVTAFTFAHSLTLSAAATDLIRVPQAPVEAVIALSVLLLAVECAHSRESLSRRWPWITALSFGLLHGFGFASALRDVGLPPDETALPLAAFNVGVELGQLFTIALLWLSSRALARFPSRVGLLERACVYAMGTLAAYWSIERTLAVFSAG